MRTCFFSAQSGAHGKRCAVPACGLLTQQHHNCGSLPPGRGQRRRQDTSFRKGVKPPQPPPKGTIACPGATNSKKRPPPFPSATPPARPPLSVKIGRKGNANSEP